MRSLDVQDGILTYGSSEENVFCKNKKDATLHISQDDLRRLISVFEDDFVLGQSVRELARVYELVREGKSNG